MFEQREDVIEANPQLPLDLAQALPEHGVLPQLAQRVDAAPTVEAHEREPLRTLSIICRFSGTASQSPTTRVAEGGGEAASILCTRAIARSIESGFVRTAYETSRIEAPPTKATSSSGPSAGFTSRS